jgi:hypothetical protein
MGAIHPRPATADDRSTAVGAVAWPRGRATQAARARHALPIREADMAAALPNVGSTLESGHHWPLI